MFGYHGLKVRIVLTPATLSPMVEIRYKDRHENAEDVKGYLGQLFRNGTCY